MPELPEVETIRRSLEDKVVGRTIQVLMANSKFSDVKKAEGKVIKSLNRRGKFLLLDLGEEEMIISLGMTGQLLAQDIRSGHVEFKLNLTSFPGARDYHPLTYVDIRKFGSVKVVPEGQYTGLLAQLGPEPLSNEFNVDDAYFFLLGKKTPIKKILLDQKLVAGIGNYLADEILFAAMIHPETSGHSLTYGAMLPNIKALVDATKTVVRESIAVGGNSFSDYVDGEGNKGNYAQYLKVYTREGQACYVCDSIIQKKVLAGRGTHFCPKCQSL